MLRKCLFPLALLLLLPLCSKERKKKGQWVIGFSQVTVKEPWRVVFNERLKKAAEKYGDKVKLIMLDADDKTENQVEHIRTFITKGVDAILVSPKEASGCSKAIKEAVEAGIIVVVLDRDITYKGYTCFVGGDNMEIGREAGRFAVELLGGPGKAKGRIYEVCGGLASTPAQERRDGFHEIVEKEKGIEILGGLDGDWKLNKAQEIVQDALQRDPDIDIIYAHNDPMALGAYNAAKQLGLEKKIKIIGIEGLTNEGCEYVKKGILTATFLYPTPGEKGLEVAVKLLEGKLKLKNKRILLPTARITKENVDKFLGK